LILINFIKEKSGPGPARYLPRGLAIGRPNQVWAMDITYLPMRRGFVYLTVVLDWATRSILSFRASNSLTTDFCVEAVEEAIARYGRPEIFNTNRGSQFTSFEFVGLLQGHGIRISMDGKGYWRDNVFVERLRKTIKYEEVYLHAYESVSEARQQLTRTSRSTTPGARTPRLTARRPTPCTSTHCQLSWPHNPAKHHL
jgi:putative transposase